MNKRIQELYTQALENKFDYGGGEGVKPGEYYSNYRTILNAEKFAELIVRECSGIAYEYDIPNLTGPGEFIGNRIKKHFGVRE